MDAIEIRKYVYDMNFSYLLLTQRLIAHDKTSAMFRLGIDEAMADTLQGLTLSQMAKLAEASQLLCLFRFDEHQTIELLTEESRVSGLQHLHAGIVLSSRLSERQTMKVMS
ncbi:flagellar transcriptional regulator FlhD [Acerihabitans sp. TG2]|uniref:flagellar transcriptional regulator FlhD n=1 Tax=Acerihabitans sp. TG2 TaxID=3096008 RepID=UPI002B2290D7|nr:flagellar transcriptional regulator FlhD [Acerihabitans sp. TG2]MEA9393212.1 flagellar transcriptional regulator FlhD [Acerihabitans sp. TG2]